ncbi:MAG: RNA methyltransferase [Deltaproteobacteria bacterium]|nr:RNA methyltransferase [Deltaproteobacteria bacterium]
MLIEITSFEDERIAAYRNLKDAPLVRSGRFVAEGELVVRTLLECGRHDVESILMTASKTARKDLLELVPEQTPVFAIEPEVMERVAGFPVHRGFLAIGRERDRSVEAKTARGPIVVLEGLSNHDNVGGIFRSAAAFRAGAVWIDDRTADPLYRKALRVSMGAALRVPWWRAPIQGLMAELSARSFARIALTPRGEAVPLPIVSRRVAAERVAILVGAEGPGLTAETLAAADFWARIPIDPELDSLNASTALAIALYAVNEAKQPLSST